MVSKTATVTNGYGIHCRPSAIIAQEAQQHEATITVTTEDGHEADPNNVLQLIGLSISCNDTVTIRVDAGGDQEREEQLCDRMVELFEYNYDFKR
mgnify:CR=1 FL=1